MDGDPCHAAGAGAPASFPFESEAGRAHRQREHRQPSSPEASGKTQSPLERLAERPARETKALRYG
jgi:hypothetical protein